MSPRLARLRGSNKRASAARRQAVGFAADQARPSFLLETSTTVSPEGCIPMSHHLDTPLASQNGQLYIDDLYVFHGDASTVFIMDVNSTVTGSKSSRDSTRRRATSLRCTSTAPISKPSPTGFLSANRTPPAARSSSPTPCAGDEARDDSATGRAGPGRTNRESASADGVRVWTGRIGDPFYSTWRYPGRSTLQSKTARRWTCLPGGRRTRANSFADTTVESIVLEVSHRAS